MHVRPIPLIIAAYAIALALAWAWHANAAPIFAPCVQPPGTVQGAPECDPVTAGTSNPLPVTPLAANQVATSATSAATLTLTPTSGQSVYVSEVHIQNCATAAVTAAAPTTITTTNLNGAIWYAPSGGAVGSCVQDVTDTFGGAPIKAAAPTTAVTFVLPTFAAGQSIRLSVYWYSAP